eukprot:Skav202819  [mRNA]  locus=scaffold3852:71476:74562:- [translate_table: standard]
MHRLAEMVRNFRAELASLSPLAAEDEATKIQVYADCLEITSEEERHQRRQLIQEVDELMTGNRKRRRTTEFDEDVVLERLKVAGRRLLAEGKHVARTLTRAFKYSETDMVNVLLFSTREPVVHQLQRFLQELVRVSSVRAELQDLAVEIPEVLKNLDALVSTAGSNLVTYNVPELYELIVRHMEEDAVGMNDTGRLASRLVLLRVNKSRLAYRGTVTAVWDDLAENLLDCFDPMSLSGMVRGSDGADFPWQ